MAATIEYMERVGSLTNNAKNQIVWAEQSIVKVKVLICERKTLVGTSEAFKYADMKLAEHLELLEGFIQHSVEKLAWSQPSYDQCKKEHLLQLDLPHPRVLEFNDL